MKQTVLPPPASHAALKKGDVTGKLIRDRWLYFMLLPGVVYFLVFKYLPMAGIVIAFQEYSPFKGIAGSTWIGLEHFRLLFNDPVFWMLIKNTLALSFLNIIFAFPLPIIVALMLNEMRNLAYKRLVQTMIYIPHFMSWVIVIGMFYVLFESQNGMVQSLAAAAGFEKFSFMLNADWFRPMYLLQNIWKECGWGTIIYLAALAGIDPQMYEAARIDGANRFRQMWHITLPSIRSTIIILLILRLGDIMDLSFDHVFLLLNTMNREVAEVFDTYVYNAGIVKGQFSFSTAVGLFKSGVGLILIAAANYLSKKLGEEGIF
ncbi:ABC transporter permease [Paenibacillus solisilvae]|uniref:ABC transporter permease n=1 Tax=Paenibacillus solisilvae TaxID=2486751 RepID=A0ABW0VZE2_9BACL